MPKYFYFIAYQTFTLTDYAGIENFGSISLAADTIHIFFVNSLDENQLFRPGGVSTINDDVLLIADAQERIKYFIALASNDIRKDIETIKFGLAHELGHYFGLHHSYNENSCLVEDEKSTNRIMDYSDKREVFTSCESAIFSSMAELFGANLINFDNSIDRVSEFELVDNKSIFP